MRLNINLSIVDTKVKNRVPPGSAQTEAYDFTDATRNATLFKSCGRQRHDLSPLICPYQSSGSLTKHRHVINQMFHFLT